VLTAGVIDEVKIWHTKKSVRNVSEAIHQLVATDLRAKSSWR
jgi:hypothetical protein